MRFERHSLASQSSGWGHKTLVSYCLDLNIGSHVLGTFTYLSFSPFSVFLTIKNRWWKYLTHRVIVRTKYLNTFKVLRTMSAQNTGILHFIVLCFIELHRYSFFVVFTNWKFVATLHQASPLVSFFQQHLLTLCLCHILVILTVFQTFSLLLYLLWWSVISNLWYYYCKKITTHWRLRWWLALVFSFFSNKAF